MRPSTCTARLFRMCRASRAVSQSFSMSRRISPIGTLRSAGCGPGDGRVTQKSVLRVTVQLRGAGNRFRCFFTIPSLLEPAAPPGVRVVQAHDHQVRRVDRARDLLLVHLLDRDALHDDRPVHPVHTDDLAFAPFEAAAHHADRIALADGDGPRHPSFRLVMQLRRDVRGRHEAFPMEGRVRRPLPLHPCLRACRRLTSHDHARGRGDSRPALRGLSGDGPLDVRSLDLALGGHDDARVVLELHHHPLRSPERTPLPHDDGVHDLLPRLRGPLLDRDDQEVRDAREREAVPDAAVLEHLDDLDDLRARVVDAFEASALREAPCLSSGESLHAATAWLWIATKWTVLPRGRHSIIVMRFPACNPRHGGAWTFMRWVRFSYRSYFRMYRRYSRSTTTVFCIFAETTTPSRL